MIVSWPSVFSNMWTQDMIPFAVVGSEANVIIDGKSVRGRKNRWGVVNVEDPNHCEFTHLRNFLTRYALCQLVARAMLIRHLEPTCKT